MGVNVRPLKDLRISLDWNFFARNYADYDIDTSNTGLGKEIVIGNPWEIPSYSTFDLSAGYSFDFGKVRATRDGANHDWESATRVFYGFGRTYNVRLKFNF